VLELIRHSDRCGKPLKGVTNINVLRFHRFARRFKAGDTRKTYFACSCASNITFRVPSSNSPVVDFGFRSDPSMGVSVSVGGLYATGVGRSNPDVSSVSSISPEFRTMPVDRSWMRLFRLSIFFGLGGGVSMMGGSI
jgi:hypothetical protein